MRKQSLSVQEKRNYRKGDKTMKQIMAIIRPNKYFKLKEDLSAKGFDSMSVYDVIGRGKNKVEMLVFTAGSGKEEYTINHPMISKKLIEVFVRDADCDAVVETIMESVHTGNHGDGKIFIMPVDTGIRIHTGEKKDESVV